MSLAIDIDTVNRVLLSDGWHDVQDESFALDAYEYLWYPSEDKTTMDAELVHGGGQSIVCATGFTFQEGIELPILHMKDKPVGIWISGPLTAIQAVETRK